MSVLRLPLYCSMRSPHAMTPALIPWAAEMMKRCAQPAGMVCTAALTPAPKNPCGSRGGQHQGGPIGDIPSPWDVSQLHGAVPGSTARCLTS